MYPETKEKTPDLKIEFASDIKSRLGELRTEVAERNQDVEERDQYVYGDLLEKSINVPVGHDKTPINWLRRTVEVHTAQFIGKGFQAVSTYDTQDISNYQDEKDKERIKVENKKRKVNAELRRRIVDAVIRDNGGLQTFVDLAENASAVGTSVLKVWYDESERKLKMVPVESIENFYAYWSDSNFREVDFVAYLWQVTETKARQMWPNLPATLTKTKRGFPLDELEHTSAVRAQNDQGMVTVMEVTGRIPNWKSEKGELKKCRPGKENLINAMVVGGCTVSTTDEDKKIPRYYILPNKQERRRPWGRSDITKAAIALNVTYVETLSDWRTLAQKVNFQKYKAYGFGPNSQIPKPKPRTVEILALGDGQDIVELGQGDANSVDFKAQMEEIIDQYVKETAISRVLFDDPQAISDSNQALMTSMKSSIDKANAKRNLWGPILTDLFTDALKLISLHESDLKDILDEEEDWHLYIQWPSVLQNEDPLYQQMLLNRWNASTMSLQTFLERQGESPEEIDRLRDEMEDALTASVLSRTLANLAMPLQQSGEPAGPDVKINLRGDLTPYQEANIASQQGFNDGPFPASAGPQGNQGLAAQENADNAQFLEGNPFNGGTPIQRGPDGQPVQAPQQATPPGVQSGNQEGQAPVSQPGSGATSVSPEGALNQTAQQSGV